MKLGIDLGATNIKSGVVDDTFQVLEKKIVPTNAHLGKEAVIQNLIEVCRQWIVQAEITSVGIGIPGRININEGILLSATNLPLKNIPLAKQLNETLKVPVYIGNDANCAIYGEIYAGEGKNANNLLMVTVGTGIGGGICINRQIYRGENETAGEFGHMIIKHRGLRCRCGKYGCWEQYASVSALICQTGKMAKTHPDSLLTKQITKNNGNIDGKTPFTATKQGCPFGEKLISNYSEYLAIGINNLITIFRPDKIVLAGEIFYQGEYLLSCIQKNIIDPQILFISQIHDRTGIIGAAMLGASSEITSCKSRLQEEWS